MEATDRRAFHDNGHLKKAKMPINEAEVYAVRFAAASPSMEQNRPSATGAIPRHSVITL